MRKERRRRRKILIYFLNFFVITQTQFPAKKKERKKKKISLHHIEMGMTVKGEQEEEEGKNEMNWMNDGRCLL